MQRVISNKYGTLVVACLFLLNVLLMKVRCTSVVQPSVTSQQAHFREGSTAFPGHLFNNYALIVLLKYSSASSASLVNDLHHVDICYYLIAREPQMSHA